MTFLLTTLLVVGMLLALSAIDNRSIVDEWKATIGGKPIGKGS